MKFAACLFFVILLSIGAGAAEIFVPDDHATIQDAIGAAAGGDTVIVRPGVYKENLDFLGKAIVVKSEKGAAVTAIDGDAAGDVVAFRSGEGVDSVLEGFTVRNGAGLVVWMLDPPNQTLYGGGVLCEQTSPTIVGNVIVENWGSGIQCWAGSPAITGNIIKENENFCGAGLACFDAAPLVTNNIIHANIAYFGGGAIWCAGPQCTPQITNNTIYGNSAVDYGGGVYCHTDASPELANSILWNNTAASGLEIALLNWASPSNLSADYSNVSGGIGGVYIGSGCTLNWGSSMISLPPSFQEASAGDFHLRWDSACRDAGDAAAAGLPAFDMEGDPRTALGSADMGADEFYYHLYHDGAVIPGSTIDIKVAGWPAAPVVVALGAGIRHPPYSTQHGDFHLLWPLLWQGALGAVPSSGILVHSATVPLGWSTGDEYPFQALVGPWGGPYTELTNLMVLRVE